MIISKYELFYGDATYDELHVEPSDAWDRSFYSIFVVNDPQYLLFLRVANINTLIFNVNMNLRLYLSHIKDIIPNVKKIQFTSYAFIRALRHCNMTSNMDSLTILKYLFNNKNIDIVMDKNDNITIINKKVITADKNYYKTLADKLIAQDKEIADKNVPKIKIPLSISDLNKYSLQISQYLRSLIHDDKLVIKKSFMGDTLDVRHIREAIDQDYYRVYTSLKLLPDEYSKIFDTRKDAIIDILVNDGYGTYLIEKPVYENLQKNYIKILDTKISLIKKELDALVALNEIKYVNNLTTIIGMEIETDYRQWFATENKSVDEYFSKYYDQEKIINILFKGGFVSNYTPRASVQTLSTQFNTQFLKQRDYILAELNVLNIRKKYGYDTEFIRKVFFTEFYKSYKKEKLSLRRFYLQFNKKIFDDWTDKSDIRKFDTDSFTLLLNKAGKYRQKKQRKPRTKPQQQQQQQQVPQTHYAQMPLDDAYKILNISRDASIPEIKTAYRKLVLQYHPDKNPNNREQAEEQFKKLNNAYDEIRAYFINVKKVAFMKRKYVNIYT